MRTRTFLRVAPAVALAAVTTLATVEPAHAGLIDGSLNNLHAVKNSNALGAVFSSNIAIEERNESNHHGHLAKHSLSVADADSNSVPRRCEATVTVTDSDGASGTMTVVIPVDVPASTQVSIPDQAPGTAWHAGDMDHVTGHLACYDTRTGAMVAMILLNEDRKAD
ncbi:hypothetical protein [Catenulispora subtropica]|uniref:Uncharacterized protein n=1 Tax=Catenulispora subtropica TaxID=450798 RepID=A0ABN2S624_9ACTN